MKKTWITPFAVLLLAAGCALPKSISLRDKTFETATFQTEKAPGYTLHTAVNGEQVLGYMLDIPSGPKHGTVLMIDKHGKLMKGYFVFDTEPPREPVFMYRDNWNKPVQLLQDRAVVGAPLHHFLSNRQFEPEPAAN